MRVLLDENFPDPPGFDPSELDAAFHAVSLSAHAPELSGNRTPDWFLYLVARQGDFDALVTRDWHQSAQTEEMWVATKTDVSVIKWKKPQEDPVVEWGQLLAYMPQVRRLREECGPSVFFLPAPVLSSRKNVEKASDQLAIFAREQGRARKELMDEARINTVGWLEEHGHLDKYAAVLGLSDPQA